MLLAEVCAAATCSLGSGAACSVLVPECSRHGGALRGWSDGLAASSSLEGLFHSPLKAQASQLMHQLRTGLIGRQDLMLFAAITDLWLIKYCPIV